MARNGKISRRTFLKAGAGVVTAGVAGAPVKLHAKQCCSRSEAPKQNSGIPLGGLGAGTVEIRDDGFFHDWQLFGNWRHEELEQQFEDAFFAFHSSTDTGRAEKRILAAEWRHGVAPVEQIGYTGQFPFATLDYCWKEAPCSVRLAAFSPFVPHDSASSGTPAAVFEFSVTNETREPLAASIAFCLPNMAGYNTPSPKHTARRVSGRSWRGVGMSAEGLPADTPSNGEVIAAVVGRGGSAASGGPKELLAAFARTGRAADTGGADAALVWKKLDLKPGETGIVTFVLAWHFPCFIDAEKIDLGRMYAHRFASAQDVASHVAANLADVKKKTAAFRDVFYRSTLPNWLMDAINAQFTTLFKSSWWTKDGTFAIWEGLGCCGLQTVDVAYYGSVALIALFPDLAKQAMRLSARHQNPSGRIPHFFPGTFEYPDAYHMIDLMPKFTLMVWRDYLWTGDRAYLNEMWPRVRAATEHNRALDRNGDFVCDNHGIDQSYDGWEFEGTSSYVGLINAAGFKAAAKMAVLCGEPELAEDYQRLAAIGAASLDRLLWNGEYFDLFYDIATDVRDTCCMSDQVNGQWFADLIELGSLLPDVKIESALKAIYAHNRKGDHLRNGVWPRGGEPDHGGQWTAVWTGTEYMVAAHMVARGLVDEGLSAAKAVYDRYAKDGRTWNHGECGDHYYRPLVALAILYAAQGFHYSAVEGRLTLAPCVEPGNHVSPLITPLAWGEVRYREDAHGARIEIEVMQGRLALRTLETRAFAAGGARVSLGGRRLDASTETLDGTAAISFAEAALGPGDLLVVEPEAGQ